MGSSTKKHKSEKKKKRSRSPERSKEKHRHHRRHHKDRKRKIEVIDVDVDESSSSDVEVELLVPPPPKISRVSPPPPPVISDEPSDGKSHDSLSIEEANKIRAKLGLKPLQVEAPVIKEDDEVSKKDTMGGVDMGEFVHKPASNIAHKTKTEKIKERLTEQKEKRNIEKKLKSVKLLTEDSDHEDDAKSWVVKLRQKEIEKKKAEQRAKLLEELDDEFGVGDLVAEDMRKTKRDAYTARDLRGLRVEHSVDGFTEGKSVILTLKDKGVLDEEDDVLVNVNMIDDERHRKNVDRRKQRPGYNLYDNEDDLSSSVLSKYDEEIDGVKNDGFELGEEQTKLQAARQKREVKEKLMKNKVLISLDTTSVKLASDYFTEEEIDAKFKKPSKKVRKIRKKPKMLKADDLLTLKGGGDDSENFGSRSGKINVKVDTSEPMDIVKEEPADDDDDGGYEVDDLTDVKLEPEESELELQLALNKARKLKQMEMNENRVDKLAKQVTAESHSLAQDNAAGSIVLNSTAEFCRTLGDIPTYGLSGNREEDGQELMDFERELKEERIKYDEESKYRGAWNQIEIDETPVEVVPSEVPILDVEPDVSTGMAGALRLAVSKGYLEKETSNRPSTSRIAHLQAQNYSIEDKAHGDDDKFGRRERYAGPTTDFKEKDSYKPSVNLEYIDDDGHILSSKEAFRYLSHKFHGKGPGKNKVEKRMKKQEQEGLMKQMSSTDTPLRTLTMLQQKQKETQLPFVVLSGNKQNHQSTSIGKIKH